MPTLLEAAGGDPAAHVYDGTSFLRALLGQSSQHRQFVYGVHNNIPEGPAYPIRAVSDGRYRYIRNLTPDEIYIEKHLMGSTGDGRLNNPYWSTWVWGAWNDRHIYGLVKRYTRRPAEQFYDTEADPYELNDLGQDRQFDETKARLRTELSRWLLSQGDPGAAQDTNEAHQAAKRGLHLFFAP